MPVINSSFFPKKQHELAHFFKNWLVVFHQPHLKKYAQVKLEIIFPKFRGENSYGRSTPYIGNILR